MFVYTMVAEWDNFQYLQSKFVTIPIFGTSVTYVLCGGQGYIILEVIKGAQIKQLLGLI